MVELIVRRAKDLSSVLFYFVVQSFLCNLTSYSTGNFSTSLSIASLLKRWSSREPDPKLHSVDIWDDVMTNRYNNFAAFLK